MRRDNTRNGGCRIQGDRAKNKPIHFARSLVLLYEQRCGPLNGTVTGCKIRLQSDMKSMTKNMWSQITVRCSPCCCYDPPANVTDQLAAGHLLDEYFTEVNYSKEAGKTK
mmetsp:Transcript_93919/g.265360  ORF Transcript_93919/g.265360 Transcript_93919/m.265360 type:complete len:110 (+) Transcript_93919:67-396(+)